MASSMTSAVRRATRASALFNKLLRQQTPFNPVPPWTTRSSYSTTTRDSDPEVNNETQGSNQPSVTVKGSPQQFKMENPFQSGGPKEVVAIDEVKDGILVRITLPGVGEDGYKVWVEDNAIFFAGRGEIEHEDEKSGRTYGGSLEFNPEFNKVDEVKAEMKHGILRMIIPNVNEC